MNKFLIYPEFASVSGKVTGRVELLEGAELNSILLDPLVNYKLEMKNNKTGFLEGEKVVVIKNNLEKRGILRTLGDEFVDLEIDNVICRIREYSSILQEKEEEFNKSAIVLEKPSNLTYLFSDTYWLPLYTMNLKDLLASFICNANIYSKELKGDVTLMAGKFNKIKSRALTLSSQSSLQNTSQSSQKFDEYHSYPLGNLEIEKEKVVPLFVKDSLEISKFYTHNVNSDNIVDHGYSFVSPFFLPSGNVYVYIESRYIGTFYFSETLTDESVELMIGPTTSVSCISSVQEGEFHNLEDNIPKIKQVTISTKISNKNDQDVELTLKYYVGKSEVVSSSIPYTERINDTLEWDLVVDNLQDYLFEVVLHLQN